VVELVRKTNKPCQTGPKAKAEH